MNKFKDKLSRLLRSFHIGTLGSIGAGIAVITCLVDLGYYAASGIDSSDAIMELVITGINCLFYLMLTKNFIAAKESNSLGLINNNLLIITIFEYIFPAINIILVNVAMNGIYGISAGFVSLLLTSSILGILYFVFLARHNKRIGKNNLLILQIIGTIILLSNLGSAGLYFTSAFAYLDVTSVAGILNAVSLVFTGITMILFGLVYCLYPFYVKREQKFGY